MGAERVPALPFLKERLHRDRPNPLNPLPGLRPQENSFNRVSWRAAPRGLVLVLSLCFCFLRFHCVRLCAALRGRSVTPMQRAQWMHFCGRVVLSAMGIRYRVEGELPVGATVIVANHLSYLDIAICSAAAPSLFVAKQEIGAWPFFGILSKLGGTIFLDRESRASAWDAADVMAERLAAGVPVLFFPEGTSTDGSEVIRFHSTLFAPAVEAGLTVTPAAIFYEPHSPGVMERDICWFGDESFLPHLLQVLGLDNFTAVVRFGTPEIFPDRRTAAYRSHDAVAALRSGKPD
jgi:lyso-ornithine lipid O-acyltransferase